MSKTNELKTLLFFHCFLILVSLLPAQNVPFWVHSPRNEALGGPHCALTDDFSTILNNPAGFRGIEGEITVSNLNVLLRGPLSTILLGIESADYQSMLADLGTSRIAVGLTGPIAFGGVGNNLAWGVFNNINTDVFIPGLTQDATVSASIDLGGVFAYSWGFDLAGGQSQLNFGLLSKVFYRTESHIAKSFTDILGAFDDLSTLFSTDSIPLDMGFGIGLDVGVKYIWRDILSFGLVFRDLYTPLFMFRYSALTALIEGGTPLFEYSTVAPVYSLGGMFSPRGTIFRGLVGNLKILFDYNDIFDFLFDRENARHVLLHFGVGLEFTVFDILSLRFGLYEGLPSLGAGLDLHIFKLNLAVYGREMGTQPGIMPVYNMMLGIDFSY